MKFRDDREPNKGLATNPRSRCAGKQKCFCWKGALWHQAKGDRRANNVALHGFVEIRRPR